MLYIGCVLDKDSQQKLIDFIDFPSEWSVKASHMTCVFKPSSEDKELFSALWGEKILLSVTAWAKDDLGLAVVVEKPPNLPVFNVIPHVTIAHSKEVGPFYSNALLQNKQWIENIEETILTSYLLGVKYNQETFPQMANLASN